MDVVIVWLIIIAAAAFLGKRLYGKFKIAGNGTSPCNGCACGDNPACARCPADITIKKSFMNR